MILEKFEAYLLKFPEKYEQGPRIVWEMLVYSSVQTKKKFEPCSANKKAVRYIYRNI